MHRKYITNMIHDKYITSQIKIKRKYDKTRIFQKSLNFPALSSLPDSSVAVVLRYIIELSSQYQALFPSHKRIASMTGFGTTAVKLALNFLESHGFIRWNNRFIGIKRPRRQITNEYFIHPYLMSPQAKQELETFMNKSLLFITYLSTCKRAIEAKFEKCLLNNNDYIYSLLYRDRSEDFSSEDWLYEGEVVEEMTEEDKLLLKQFTHDLLKQVYG